MNPVLISHLFPSPARPHQGTFVMEKAMALARRMPLRVCAPVAWAPLLRRRPPKIITHGDLTIFHPVYPGLPGILFKHRQRAYRAALRAFFSQTPRPDVIMVDWVYPDAHAVLEFCRSWKVPVIITAHGANAIGYYSHANRLPFFTRPLLEADRVIAVSADLRRKIMAVAGVPTGKITVIPNGVDPEVFALQPRDRARAELGLPPDTPLIVAVARLAPEKALHLLVQAFNHIHDQRAQLRIIGEGPLRRRLQAVVRRLRLEGRVQFMGGIPRPEVARWLNAADVFALSSLHEGDPVVIREALACGTPVVATRVGGIPELITGEQYGLLCEANDSLQLAHRLNEGLTRAWDREALSQYGRRHTWDTVAGKLLDICREVMPC